MKTEYKFIKTHISSCTCRQQLKNATFCRKGKRVLGAIAIRWLRPVLRRGCQSYLVGAEDPVMRGNSFQWAGPLDR